MTKFEKVLMSMFVLVSLWLASVYGLSVEGVTPINNRDYAPAMLKLLQKAQKNIKLMLFQASFYEDYPETMSNKFVAEIEKATKRGVNVMAVIDISDWNPDRMKYNKEFGSRLVKAGAEVYLDDPKIISHQKIILIDDVITVIGSTNWSYYSLDKNNETSAIIWSTEVNKAYTDYFNERMAEAERYLPQSPRPDLELATTEGLRVLMATDVKLLNNRSYFPEVHTAISQAKKKVWVAQMQALYYMVRPKYAVADVPSTTTAVPSLTNLLLKDLLNAQTRGVDVRVLLDAPKGRTNVNVDFANRLLAGGVKVYFDDPEVTTHCKMVIVDDNITIIGSTNWSLNALEQGHEASVLIASEEVNRVYTEYFEGLLKSGMPVTATSEFQQLDISTTVTIAP